MISAGEGRYLVKLVHFFIGEDLLIIITGGDEHIGGVSLVESNSCSSIYKKNHKDNVISDMVAPIIYNSLKKDTLVVCGIHLDDATLDDIDILINNAQDCAKKFLKEVNNDN